MRLPKILTPRRFLRPIRLNRNIITYLICVVIASILWFLNTLNQDYSAEISYPVRYVNFPQGKYPISSLPGQIGLEVKAKGFALLGYRIRTSFLPINLNVSAYSTQTSDKDSILEYTLNMNNLKDKISNQLSQDIKLQSINPEKIIFRLARSIDRKIAVVPDLRYTLKRQYIIDNIRVHPDSISVSGPAPLIDTLQKVYTHPIKLKNIGKNVTLTTELSPIPDCRFANVPIEVEVLVEQFTEAKKTIPITPLNVPDSLTIRLFPDYVNISYEIGLSKYEKVSDDDFTFTVDYPGTSGNPYLEVKARHLPSYIKNPNFFPQKVEYILERK